MNIFDLKVGFECNNKCIHCVITDKSHHEKLSLQEMKNIVDDNIDNEIFVLTGGEPTFHPNFLDIVDYLHSKNRLIYIQTNGKLLTQEMVMKLKGKVNHFLIALHSSRKECHEMISGVRGSFEESVNAIRNVYEIMGKDYVTSQTVISKINYHLLYETYSFLQENFPTIKMNMTFPHPNGDAWHNRNIVVPKYSDFKDEIYDCLKDFGQYINTEAIPLCYINPFINKVNYSENGIINKDFGVSGFDKGAMGKMEDYNTLISQDHIKVESCNDCFYNNKCLGVWREYGEMYEYLDLPPIKKKDLVISVRTKYFDIFKNHFFDSFLKYYSEYLPDLNVYIDSNYEEMNQKDYNRFKHLATSYGFILHFTKRDDEDYFIFNNHYSHMLWKSVDHPGKKVISFDDDVKFHNSGVFDTMSDLLDKHPIISETYRGTRELTDSIEYGDMSKNTLPYCISSWSFGVNNSTLTIQKDDFVNKRPDYCDGNDMVGFTVKYKNNIYYMDGNIESIDFLSKTVNKFYKHKASATWLPDYETLKLDYGKLDDEKREILKKRMGNGTGIK